MFSDLPKALHKLCGKSMLWHLLSTIRELKPKRTVVVVGNQKKLITRELAHGTSFVWQRRQLGSGHAVACARSELSGFQGRILVLYCDTPLIKAQTLKGLLQDAEKKNSDCSLLSVRLGNPTGYGRLKRDPRGWVQKIVEETDLSSGEKRLQEVNVGCYVFHSKKLFQALEWVRQNPKKKEYYLTDTVEILSRRGRVSAVCAGDVRETMGVNTRFDLSLIQGFMQEAILKRWIEKGVEIRDPKTTTIDADVEIGAGSVILSHTVIEEGSRIGRGCRIGPFARIRGASRVEDGAVVGNFVELVRSRVGRKTFIKHLSYIGDSEIGSEVNVGAGTITANYDGKKKHKTVIGDKAQIGSGTILIAPVTVGRSAKTGAGAVVTKNTHVKDRSVFMGVPAREIKKA